MTDRAVVFDLDNTLIELAVDIEAVRDRLTAMFAQLGYDGPFRPILPCIDEAARVVSDAPEQRRAWVARGRAVIDDAEVAAPLVIKPGALALIAALERAGVPLGLVTDNGRACAQRALAALHMPARAIATRDDVTAPKPDPEGLCSVATRLLPAGGTLWMIGDSVRDIRAVAAARRVSRDITWRALGVSGGRDTGDALRRDGAERVCQNLAEIAPILGIDARTRYTD